MRHQILRLCQGDAKRPTAVFDLGGNIMQGRFRRGFVFFSPYLYDLPVGLPKHAALTVTTYVFNAAPKSAKKFDDQEGG